jgi:hypothetical protein
MSTYQDRALIIAMEMIAEGFEPIFEYDRKILAWRAFFGGRGAGEAYHEDLNAAALKAAQLARADAVVDMGGGTHS